MSRHHCFLCPIQPRHPLSHIQRHTTFATPPQDRRLLRAPYQVVIPPVPLQQVLIVLGDFNYDPRRGGVETEVDREVRMFVDEMRLQDVSYSGALGPSHYPALESSVSSRIDAPYVDPRWVKGVTPGYMVGSDKMKDRRGHCPMMVTVDVKVGDPVDEEEDEQGQKRRGSICCRWYGGRRSGMRGGSSKGSKCTSK